MLKGRVTQKKLAGESGSVLECVFSGLSVFCQIIEDVWVYVIYMWVLNF